MMTVISRKFYFIYSGATFQNIYGIMAIKINKCIVNVHHQRQQNWQHLRTLKYNEASLYLVHM